MSANKQRYWMVLTLVRSNGAYVGVALNQSIYEGMNDISNVNVHLKTRSGNVNINKYMSFVKLTRFLFFH